MTKNTGIIGGDERIATTPYDETRGSRASASVERQDEDGTALNAAERRASLRREWEQEALPSPPNMTGYHTCWLSTTSAWDSIQKRLRMGYSLVTAEELPGFKTGDAQLSSDSTYTGCVTCNEMVLAKIPNDRYQDIMATFHHDIPLEEEQKVKELAMVQKHDSNGTRLGHIEGEGISELGRKVRTPIFQ